MAADKFILGIFFLIAVGCSRVPDRNLLKSVMAPLSGYNSSLRNWLGKFYPAYVATLKKGPRKTYKKLIPIAEAELWVREETGNNDGARIEEYQRCVGINKGDPYYAAFVSWVFEQAGYTAPRTGWSPSLFPYAKLVKAAAPGNVFGIYFPSLKRIAHCGFVECVKGDWIGTIKANTNIAGSREGDGVYRRLRHKRSIYKYSDWQIKQ